MRYFEVGKCANCGKKIGPDDKLKGFNADLEQYHAYPLRPYFCSDKCADASIDLKAIEKKYEQRYERLASFAALVQKGLDQFDDEFSDAIDQVREEERKYEEFCKGLPLEIAAAYSAYFEAYAEAVMAADIERAEDPANALRADAPPARYSEPTFNDDLPAVLARIPHTGCKAFDDAVTSLILALYEAKTTHDFTAEPPYRDVVAALNDAADRLPSAKSDSITIGTRRLADILPRDCIVRLAKAFWHERVRRNIRRIAGIELGEPVKDEDPRKTLAKVKIPDAELALEIFDGTPLHAFLNTEIPFKIFDINMMSHTHVLCGTGHGKTTLLMDLFMQYAQRENPPSMIVIDGKGTWAPELQRLKIFAQDSTLSKNMLFIDPRDTERPTALNLFAMPQYYRQASESDQRRMRSNVASLMSYIFSARGFDLTPKQATCLSYCAAAVLTMPEPTLALLKELLLDTPLPKEGGIRFDSKFRPTIDALPTVIREFFRDSYYNKTEYGETRKQVLNRIKDLEQSPAFADMFGAATRSIDIFEIMRDRKILIVDSSPATLGDAAPTLGRFVLAEILNAARARSSVPKSEWTPVIVFLDEVQIFIDERVGELLLQQVREFGCGIILSHQKLADLTFNLRATFAGNTKVKFCGGASADDTFQMAKDMLCAQEFISAQKLRRNKGTTSFACYVDGVTDSAVSVTIPLGLIDKTPKMSDEEYHTIVARNRALTGEPVKKPADKPKAPAARPVVEKPEKREKPRAPEPEETRVEIDEIELDDRAGDTW
ncbi:ATP-binding protein [Rhodopseudomonas palustris]|uniref:ATP-binding protein n=1 Tax=Rhodopseudomonas palustris TaxID=1076 RepID=UPI000D1AB027|nr:ATP-binding protein [Rhodopseudomonas palustris]AVT83689.1 hypothetical protein RPYSC3_48290 [Rhodopseudomonas palustris]